MNFEYPIRSGCSDEFGELCALSTTGGLTADEQLRLDRHLAICGECKNLIVDYRGLAVEGAAKMAGSAEVDWENMDHPWDQTAAKDKLLNRLQAKRREPRPFRRLSLRPLQTAAIILIGILVGYYVAGGRPSQEPRLQPPPQPISAGIDETTRQQQITQLQSQRDQLNAQLAVDTKRISDLTERVSRTGQQLAEIKHTKEALEGQVESLAGETREQADAARALLAQRDALQRSLEEARRSLESVREDLNRRKDENQKTLLRAASLETRIEELSSELLESSNTVQQQKDFLASDRDVRELMGARQLYIADVFDVDHSGKKQPAFGRVFYTKGKSLIFYAFDLDQAPGSGNSKAFQVWGSPSEDQSKPVSLGVFYKDSEANRRWVFKTENPETLAQINAVFVTVETKGPNIKPTGKPILYAYLRTAPPNHP